MRLRTNHPSTFSGLLAAVLFVDVDWVNALKKKSDVALVANFHLIPKPVAMAKWFKSDPRARLSACAVVRYIILHRLSIEIFY